MFDKITKAIENFNGRRDIINRCNFYGFERLEECVDDSLAYLSNT